MKKKEKKGTTATSARCGNVATIVAKNSEKKMGNPFGWDRFGVDWLLLLLLLLMLLLLLLLLLLLRAASGWKGAI